MKLPKLLFLLVILLFATQIASAQNENNPCWLILQGGLYRTYNITKTSNFTQDFKTYLVSDTFKQDFKSGKWGADLFAVINGTPAELNINSSDAQIAAFQQRVRTSTSFSLNQSFYEFAKIAVPDVELGKVYAQCVKDLPPVVGFRVIPIVNERDVVFEVTYKKFSSSDLMPRVTFFQVKNAINVGRVLSVGSLLQDSNTITADRDPNKDLTLILETDKGAVTYRVPADPGGFNKDFPVGTIITSYLNWSEFQAVTQNNLNNPAGNVWSSRFSKWSPADGREIPNSALLRATSQSRVPDLRGMFLRGLNVFDPEQSSTVASDRRDPDNRNRGDFQSDAFEAHNHGVNDPGHSHTLRRRILAATPGGYGQGGRQGGGDTHDIPPVNQTEPSGTNITIQNSGNSSETRPNNVAIFYYIRIN